MADLPKQARAVIIGGGVVGCSVAYHLAKQGWTDVVLLERKQLTSGTTWHAAGLIGQLRATPNLIRLAHYSCELYANLEAETEVATGFVRHGSLGVALSGERMEEFARGAAMGRMWGVEAEMLSPEQCKKLYPLLELKGDVKGGVLIPGDGQADPSNIALALAKGARNHGAKVLENVKVTGIEQADGRVTGVNTDQGPIQAEVVVNCAGMWGREVGRMAGVSVPLQACEHFYIVTEKMDGMGGKLPVLRVPDECTYYKEDAGRLLLGCFEPNAKPWGLEGIPDDFCFDSLPEDFEHFEPILAQAMERVPALQDVGIHTFFNGPESFTPDDRYILGEAPELQNFYLACGFNSIGIQSAGGVGKALAEWIEAGEPPFDLSDVDIRRLQPFQANRTYLEARVSETLGLLYDDHFPFRQYETARQVRRTPLHDALRQHGACFGELAGWERPNWFAPEGVEPIYEYSWGRQNWFAHSAAEHRAVRSDCGLFDLSTFAKFLVQGPDAAALLNRVSAAQMDVAPGRVVYTQWLNDRGGIEADLTVTRLAEDRYMVVTAAGSQRRDFVWLERNLQEGERVYLTDVTSGMAVIGLMGPRARDLLQPLTTADLSNAAFPFGTSRQIELGSALVQASRITYVGELGWELYIPTEFTGHVFETIMETTQPPALAGLHALNSLRMECGYRHWGDDLTDEDTPLEAGLSFAVDWTKDDFNGREALLKQKQAGVERRLVQFRLSDPEPLLYHDEPVWLDGERVGHLTSGAYGHEVGAALGMGYVTLSGGRAPKAVDLEGAAFELEIGRQRCRAQASIKPFFDPKRERIRM
ncbi:GcvT family protein [Fodinicurvata sediminis]|uniref:GcvT family protein n=1 Tax=Fodinicurvata sediminis TaxID=1121832 RepID=UPI0003B6A4BB|nr:FAD-dependent oxidoreductase [Fodinicurvata sediminis]